MAHSMKYSMKYSKYQSNNVSGCVICVFVCSSSHRTCLSFPPSPPQVLIPWGCDYAYQNAELDYRSTDWLIDTINEHPEWGVHVQYVKRE